MNISKRLKAVSDFLEDNSNIIDVGCDHALLDIYLFKNKKNIKLIASDVKSGPLDQAKKNIDKYNCDIEIRQGDGLDTITSDIDTIVITGMGGDTIISILEKGKGKLQQIKCMVLSPQSEWVKVRKYITSLGFYIEDEQIIMDSGKFYLIEKLKKGKRRYDKTELEFGPILLKNKSETFLTYYQNLIMEKENIIKKIPIYKIKDRFKEKIMLKKMKRIINK